jgi:hypothetical protein
MAPLPPTRDIFIPEGYSGRRKRRRAVYFFAPGAADTRAVQLFAIFFGNPEDMRYDFIPAAKVELVA